MRDGREESRSDPIKPDWAILRPACGDRKGRGRVFACGGKEVGSGRKGRVQEITERTKPIFRGAREGESPGEKQTAPKGVDVEISASTHMSDRLFPPIVGNLALPPYLAIKVRRRASLSFAFIGEAHAVKTAEVEHKLVRRNEYENRPRMRGRLERFQALCMALGTTEGPPRNGESSAQSERDFAEKV